MLYTPGHTDDCYSFTMADRVFTGDTLLIRGTGRTDFQNGDPRAQYERSSTAAGLPDETLVFRRMTTRATRSAPSPRRRAYNPRLQVRSVEEYVDADERPEAVQPEDDGRGGAGQHAPGLAQEEVARRGWAVTAAEARRWSDSRDVALIDLREKRRAGAARLIPGALHAPYPDLQENIRAGRHAARARRRDRQALVFFCAFGERSAMAVQAAQDAGHRHRLPHPRRHGRLEEGGRSAGALTECAPAAARCGWRHVR